MNAPPEPAVLRKPGDFLPGTVDLRLLLIIILLIDIGIFAFIRFSGMVIQPVAMAAPRWLRPG